MSVPFFERIVNRFGSLRRMLRRDTDEARLLRQEIYQLSSGLFRLTGTHPTESVYYASHVTDEALPEHTIGEESDGSRSMTSTSNGRLVISESNCYLNDIVLVRHALDPKDNGLYIHAAGDDSNPWKLTRHASFRAALSYPDHMVVQMGSAGSRAGAAFQLTTRTAHIGVTPIVFEEVYPTRIASTFAWRWSFSSGADNERVWVPPGRGSYTLSDVWAQCIGGAGTTGDVVEIYRRKSSDSSEVLVASLDMDGVAANTLVRVTSLTTSNLFAQASSFNYNLVIKAKNGSGEDKPTIYCVPTLYRAL